AAQRRSARDRATPDRAPAPLPADAARDRLHERHHDRLPRPDRPDQAVLRQRCETRGRQLRELRQDPLSGRTVVIAPARARRPGAARGQIPPATEEELETCPFCEGREERTPPEVFAIAPAHRDPDTPGWQARVVP